MRWISRLKSRWRSLFRRRRVEQELDAELRFHLEQEIEANIAAGMSHDDGRSAALRSLGSVSRLKELCYEALGFQLFDDARQDVHHALRALLKNPAFAFIAVLTLALGIGANAAVFSVVNAILVRPLPYKDSDRLVRIIENIPGAESLTGAPERTATMSADDFLEWRTRTTTLSHMALRMPASITLTGREAVRLSGAQVSPAIFPMLGAQAMLGRVFEANDERPGSDRVVILSYGGWRTYFGADPQALGRPVPLDGTTYSVIGIMPRDFEFPDAQTTFWTPLALTREPGRFLRSEVTARLKDGVTVAAATHEANTISRQLRGELPLDPHAPASGLPRIQIVPLKDELVAPVRSALFVLMVAVGLVLLIACVNIANLFLARAVTRHPEIALRIALGAGRGRVLRQFLTESLVLALFGGAVGWALACAGTQFLRTIGQSLGRLDLARPEGTGNTIPRLNEIGVDASVHLYILAITILTGMLFALIPLLGLRRMNLIGAVASRTHSVSSRVNLNVARTFAVIGQVSLTMVLLLAAGLLIRSFVKLANVDLGFDPTNVLTFQITQPHLRYPQDVAKQPQQTAFAEDVVTRLQAVPGIQAAAFANFLPMVQGRVVLSLRTTANGPNKPIPQGNVLTISRDYLRVLGRRVIAGRGFNDGDRIGQGRPLLVNRTLARELFGDANPIGKTVYSWWRSPGEIVGVVDDIRESALNADPEPQLLMDPEHTPQMIPVNEGGLYFAVRTDKETAAVVPMIRSIVHQLNPKLPLDNIATMGQIVSNSITQPRVYALLLGVFAGVALALAAIGIYGVMAYVVTQRTREIGVRMALGAKRGDVLGLVLGQSAALTVGGIVVGLLGGVAVTRYLHGMLFGLTPLDPPTFVAASLIFVLVGTLAAYVPARRAVKVDQVVALRCE